MNLRQIAVFILGLIVIAATLAPFVRRSEWWIRMFDFPRPQILVLGLVAAAGLLTSGELSQPPVAGFGLAIAVAIAIAIQAYKIFPYTPLARKQVRGAWDPQADSTLSLLVANVLMDNRHSAKLLAVIDELQPDLVLTLEPDDWWAEELGRLDYPHSIAEPRDNRYGIVLQSRLELIEPQIKHLVSEDVPSIHTHVRLRSGAIVSLHGLHPEPPSPTEAEESTERDAELLIVGRGARSEAAPVIVAGDLNDVAWSRTTRLFRKISGLLDPRIGRGLFNTFHARIPVLRFPLDQVLHTKHFYLVALRRLPAFGSDHFPLYAELSLEPQAPLEQEAPRSDSEIRREARAKIDAVDPLDTI